VVEVNDKFHPDGANYLIKDHPKDSEPRRLKLSAQITTKLRNHVRVHAMGAGDLIFAYRPTPSAPRQPLDPAENLGLTEPNAHGRRTSTEPSRRTRPDLAGARTAAAPTPTTAPNAAPRATTTPPEQG
jgi:hypothetical protein